MCLVVGDEKEEGKGCWFRFDFSVCLMPIGEETGRGFEEKGDEEGEEDGGVPRTACA